MNIVNYASITVEERRKIAEIISQLKPGESIAIALEKREQAVALHRELMQQNKP